MNLEHEHLWWKQSGAAELRGLFLDCWDPIGVEGSEQAENEYDGYRGGVLERLSGGEGAQGVAEYLSWAWLDTKLFDVPGWATPRLSLQMLLRHPLYRDDYLSPDSAEHTTADIQGPFVLSHITESAFSPAEADAAKAALAAFVASAELSDDASTLLADLSALLQHSSHRWQLTNMADDEKHDYGWTLTKFDEFVVMDSQRRRLVLVVAGAD